MRGLDVETDPYWIHGHLLWKAESIDLELTSGTHEAWYKTHLDNSIYRTAARHLGRCNGAHPSVAPSRPPPG